MIVAHAADPPRRVPGDDRSATLSCTRGTCAASPTPRHTTRRSRRTDPAPRLRNRARRRCDLAQPVLPFTSSRRRLRHRRPPRRRPPSRDARRVRPGCSTGMSPWRWRPGERIIAIHPFTLFAAVRRRSAGAPGDAPRRPRRRPLFIATRCRTQRPAPGVEATPARRPRRHAAVVSEGLPWAGVRPPHAHGRPTITPWLRGLVSWAFRHGASRASDRGSR